MHYMLLHKPCSTCIRGFSCPAHVAPDCLKPVTENRKVPARAPQLHPDPQPGLQLLTNKSNTQASLVLDLADAEVRLIFDLGPDSDPAIVIAHHTPHTTSSSSINQSFIHSLSQSIKALGDTQRLSARSCRLERHRPSSIPQRPEA